MNLSQIRELISSSDINVNRYNELRFNTTSKLVEIDENRSMKDIKKPQIVMKDHITYRQFMNVFKNFYLTLNR